ncbi:MAG TPA: lipoyl(octanoyl) transferase LipB [Gemmatimonadota bacterium]|nr:lipoyl(octanoyl) transferase LipB [Gemmatimonadota bacterium]
MSPNLGIAPMDDPVATRDTRAVVIRRLGCVSYRAAWALQREEVAERSAGRIPDTLLLLEHPPVITMGKAASADHLLGTRADLARRDIELVRTDRGGDITFHGPGQIVGYAIVDLGRRGRDLHRYLRDLEEVVIRALEDFGISAGRSPGLTGVWVGAAKIAAIGIRISRWVTHHGFALNVDTDLSYYDLIVPCGLTGRRVTSMQALLDGPVERATVEDALGRAFRDVFGDPAGGPSR